MNFPTTEELLALPSLVPREEIAERLDEAMRAVDKFKRTATVTLTLKISYDEDFQTIDVVGTVKSKRAVRVNRREEVESEEFPVLSIKEEIPGQTRIDEP